MELEEWEGTQPVVLVMVCWWSSVGAASRSLLLSIQRHIPSTVFVFLAGFGLGWYGTEVTHDGFTCYSLKAISEKVPVLGISPLVVQLRRWRR